MAEQKPSTTYGVKSRVDAPPPNIGGPSPSRWLMLVYLNLAFLPWKCKSPGGAIWPHSLLVLPLPLMALDPLEGFWTY